MTIELHLDDPDADHPLDASLAGTVVVEVDAQRHGTLEVGWELISTASTGRPRALSLFGLTREIREGLWEPGAPIEQRFEIPTPDGPASYTGREVQLTWHLYARLAIPETGDKSTASVPVPLRPADGDRLILERTGGCDPDAVSRRSAAPATWSALALVGGLVGTALGIASVGLGLLIPAALLALFAALMLWSTAREYRAKGVVGDVQVDVADGGRVITAWTLPGAPIERAALLVTVRERSEVGQGESKTVKTHDAWSNTAELARESAGVWRGAIEMPDPGVVPPQIYGGSRTIQWLGEIVLIGADGVELWRDYVTLRARLERGSSEPA